jgi:hypothetical protein
MPSPEFSQLRAEWAFRADDCHITATSEEGSNQALVKIYRVDGFWNDVGYLHGPLPTFMSPSATGLING